MLISIILAASLTTTSPDWTMNFQDYRKLQSIITYREVTRHDSVLSQKIAAYAHVMIMKCEKAPDFMYCLEREENYLGKFDKPTYAGFKDAAQEDKAWGPRPVFFGGFEN